MNVWRRLGCPKLSTTTTTYHSATGDKISIKGKCTIQASIWNKNDWKPFIINVTNIPGLNLIGRNSIQEFEINVNKLLREANVKHVFVTSTSEITKECKRLCSEFEEIFAPDLACLKNFELDIKFKEGATPIFKKPRTVPFAILDDVNDALEDGVRGSMETDRFQRLGYSDSYNKKKSPNTKLH